MDAATKAIVTDPALGSISRLLALVDTLNQVPDGKTTYVTVPNDPYPPDPNRVVWSEPGASELWDSLRTGVAPETSNASVGAGAGADTGTNPDTGTSADTGGAGEAAGSAAAVRMARMDAGTGDATTGAAPTGGVPANPSPSSYTCPAS
jgi:hypothetical protein